MSFGPSSRDLQQTQHTLFSAYPEAVLPTWSLANGPTLYPGWPCARPRSRSRMTPRILLQILIVPESLAATGGHLFQF